MIYRMGEILKKAIEFVTQATQEDKNQNYSKAFSLYIRGVEHFLHVIKYETKTEKEKIKIRKRCEEYLDRAEKLKKLFNRKNNKTQNKKGEVFGEDEKLNIELEGAIVTEKPNVLWSDVIDLEDAKEAIKEAVIFPLKFPQLFTGKRQPWKGILLYGLPGTGKSYLAKAVATEAKNSTFFSVSSSNLVSKWLGESEKLIRNLFEMARHLKPSIIFIDEVDSLCSSRSENESESTHRIKTEFLVQMQGVGKENNQVLVLGATNTPWVLDSAIQRRFEKRIYIPLPDEKARYDILKTKIANEHTLNEEDFKYLAKKTEGYSAADITVLMNDAGMEPIRKIIKATHFCKLNRPDSTSGQMKDVWIPCSSRFKDAIEMTWMDIQDDSILDPPIAMNDVIKCLENFKPSVNEKDMQRLNDFLKISEHK